MSNPNGRPKDTQRIESMKRWFKAAEEMLLIINGVSRTKGKSTVSSRPSRDQRSESFLPAWTPMNAYLSRELGAMEQRGGAADDAEPTPLQELYSSKTFPHKNTGMTPVQEMLTMLRVYRKRRFLQLKLSQIKARSQHAQKLKSLAERIQEKYDLLCEDHIVAWHDFYGKHAVPLSMAPHGNKGIVYDVAAELFNTQLKEDQQGNPDLGIKPDRLEETPITGNALRVAMIREMDPD